MPAGISRAVSCYSALKFDPRNHGISTGWRADRRRTCGKRKALYEEFQRIVNEELPLYFINEEPYVTVSHRTVMGPPETVWGPMQPLDQVWLDR